MSRDDDASDELRLVATEPGRLDAMIAARSELSRATVQKLIDDGRVTLNGVIATKAGTKVRIDDVIEVEVPPPEPLEVVAEDIPLAILYEDADVIVIDKPAGLVVHPAAGHPRGTLVNALLHHCKDLSGIGGVQRPGIVHRLDRDTTGVMVATKSDRAHLALAEAFQTKRDVERSYLAIASPRPRTDAGTIRTMYGRHPVDRKRFSSKVAQGKPAITHYQVLERLHESALVRFRLETGRTHQIRVHASDHGFALIGDAMYGTRPRDERIAEVARALGRQALHANTLGFVHPGTGERMQFEAPVPADFTAALAGLR